jgi:hypothetical protein
MPKAGDVPIPISSASRRNVAMWDIRNFAGVVQICPAGKTY